MFHHYYTHYQIFFKFCQSNFDSYDLQLQYNLVSKIQYNLQIPFVTVVDCKSLNTGEIPILWKIIAFSMI